MSDSAAVGGKMSHSQIVAFFSWPFISHHKQATEKLATANGRVEQWKQGQLCRMPKSRPSTSSMGSYFRKILYRSQTERRIIFRSCFNEDPFSNMMLVILKDRFTINKFAVCGTDSEIPIRFCETAQWTTSPKLPWLQSFVRSFRKRENELKEVSLQARACWELQLSKISRLCKRSLLKRHVHVDQVCSLSKYVFCLSYTFVF